ncbi:ankyrin repeat domain-containing protein [Brachyspira hyodysenteriae]|uniref:ankyrin repeat domain-containing protein n=1 Tax=Brachyspira hyodysenteriae TaxID=159 RepID=UPI00063D9F72|nr:ankyrin repeat domain-containing protein [Brachyspira hyodysenteriae]KLI21665.1 ankyrin [Brachyspira hyodysenteriae]
MKKIVLMAILYTLFNFNALYPANSENEALFLSYIASGDIEEVSNFIDNKKININARIENSATPLIFSIIFKQDEIAKMLIGKGADLNIKDKSGFTALIYSIMYNRIEISKILIEKKADVNTKVSLNENVVYMKNVTPLILNENKEVAQSLVNAGADINIKFSFQHAGKNIKLENATPLMWFIFNDNSEIAKLLIESGADINAKDKSRKTALDYAKEKNNAKIEQLLITKGAK